MANIFIVEDDRASARLLGLLLKKGGHSSSVAYSLEEARKWLFFQPELDLMIPDNRLGDNYGWELLSELRNHFYFRHLPVIVYTAAGDRDSVGKYVALKVQAIRAAFPGVYGLILLDPANHPARKYKSAFTVVGRAFASKLKLPNCCQESLHVEGESSFSETASARLFLGLFLLGGLVADGYDASERGQNLDGIRREFTESTAWNLLAGENLQLPPDRARFFEGLLESVPAMHQRVDALLAYAAKKPAVVS